MQIDLKSARRSCCKTWAYFLSLPFRDDYFEDEIIIASVLCSVNGDRDRSKDRDSGVAMI
jgi:hypothetical protein